MTYTKDVKHTTNEIKMPFNFARECSVLHIAVRDPLKKNVSRSNLRIGASIGDTRATLADIVNPVETRGSLTLVPGEFKRSLRR